MCIALKIEVEVRKKASMNDLAKFCHTIYLRSNFTKSVHSFEVQILQNMSEVPVQYFFEIASHKVTPARRNLWVQS